MNPYLIFFFGMIVGACLGILAISLCCMAGRGSREEEPIVRDWKDVEGRIREAGGRK